MFYFIYRAEFQQQGRTSAYLRTLFAIAILLLLLKPMPPVSLQETFRRIPQLHTSGQLHIKKGFVQLRYGLNFVGDSS